MKFQNDFSINNSADIEKNQLLNDENKIIKKKKQLIYSIIIIFVILAITLTLIFTLQKNKNDSNEDNNSSDQDNNDIIINIGSDGFYKPDHDLNNYEIFTMQNGLQVLLIKSPNNYDVGVSLMIQGLGSYVDPNDYQGMAHFLEHMVFMGSKNYPITEYLDVVFKYNGNPNGMTYLNWTEYPTSVPKQEMLDDVLSRIADYVLNPQIQDSKLKREIYAVDSEYHNDLAEGIRQVFNAAKMLAKPSHPFSKLSVGNYQTLQGLIQDSTPMKNFHDQYYIPNKMYLVIYTHEDNAQHMKNLTQHLFQNATAVNNTNYSQADTAFNDTILGSFIKIKQHSDLQQMTIMHALPLLNNDYTKSIDFIFSMIDSVASPLICQTLLNQSLVTSCFIDNDQESQEEIFVLFQVTLTDSGVSKLDYIISLFYSYIQRMLEQGVVTQVNYDLMGNLSKLQFKGLDQPVLFEHLVDIAIKFMNSPNKKVFYQPYDFNNYNESQIKYFLNQIKLENAIIFLQAQDFSSYNASGNIISSLTQFLQINDDSQFSQNTLHNLKYQIYKIKSSDATYFNQQINQLGPSIQYNQTIKIQKSNKINDNIQQMLKPQLIISEKQGNLWYFGDISYQTPKVFIYILIEMPFQSLSQINKQITYQILAQFVNIDAIATAETNMLGIIIKIQSSNNITVNSLRKIAQILKNFTDPNNNANLKLFNQAKQMAINSIKKLRQSNPWTELAEDVGLILLDTIYSKEDLINGINNMQFQYFQQNIQQIFSQSRIEMFYGGNIGFQTAKDQYQYFKNEMGNLGFENDFLKLRVLNITSPSNSYILRQFHTCYDEFNMVAGNYYQFGNLTNREQYILQILSKFITGRAFNYLRAELQLGYVARAQIYKYGPIFGLTVFVQGYREQPENIDQDIEQLLYKVEQELIDLNEDYNFDLAFKNLPKPSSLNAQMNQFWDQIMYRQGYTSTDVNWSNKVTKQDILNYFYHWFKNQKSKLSLQLYNPYITQNFPTSALNSSQQYSGANSIPFQTKEDLINFGQFSQYEIRLLPNSQLN